MAFIATVKIFYSRFKIEDQIFKIEMELEEIDYRRKKKYHTMTKYEVRSLNFRENYLKTELFKLKNRK